MTITVRSSKVWNIDNFQSHLKPVKRTIKYKTVVAIILIWGKLKTYINIHNIMWAIRQITNEVIALFL